MSAIASSSDLSRQPGESSKKGSSSEKRYSTLGYGADNLINHELLKDWVDTAVSTKKKVFRTDGVVVNLPFKSAILRSPQPISEALKEYEMAAVDEKMVKLMKVSAHISILLRHSRRHGPYNDDVTGCLPRYLCGSCWSRYLSRPHIPPRHIPFSLLNHAPHCHANIILLYSL